MLDIGVRMIDSLCVAGAWALGGSFDSLGMVISPTIKSNSRQEHHSICLFFILTADVSQVAIFKRPPCTSIWDY